MTGISKNFKELSVAYEDLNTRYADLSSRFRAMRSTLSNKYQENILAELEAKTLELQELSNKVNLSEKFGKKNEVEEAHELKINQLESVIDNQTRRIKGLERDRAIFQSDIHSLTLELKEKEQTIEHLTKLNTQLLQNNEHEPTVKGKKYFFKVHTKQSKRASTVDVLDISANNLEIPSPNPKFSSGKSSKHKPPVDPDRIQEELENPLPRPRSPHPIYIPYPEHGHGEVNLSKSLPVSPTSPDERKVLNF